jgi:CubicO group peptidase (beta-lactamase class C family)
MTVVVQSAFQITPTMFSGINGLVIDSAAVQAYAARVPADTSTIISSRGLEEGNLRVLRRTPPAAAYQFDIDGFATSLHAAMKNSVAGYAMQLRQHGTPICTLLWNWAKCPVDGGAGWSLDRRMHIASCSKLITAMAMTHLLNKKNISPDTKIAPYLPKYWSKGMDVGLVSFRDLMTHRSGFVTGQSDSSYDFMKSVVSAGSTDHGNYHYENMNFGLCRILIATMNGNISPSQTWPFPPPVNVVFNDAMWDFVTIAAYKTYVEDHLFTPAGVSGPALTHASSDALAYSFPASGPGWDSGDLTSLVGGVGWHMSVNELSRVMGAFRRGNAIMGSGQAQAMLDSGFGIDVILNTPLGTLYNKNGGWGSKTGPNEQSLAYFLPQDMELVVLTNSHVSKPPVFFRDFVTNIYLASIKPA